MEGEVGGVGEGEAEAALRGGLSPLRWVVEMGLMSTREYAGIMLVMGYRLRL